MFEELEFNLSLGSDNHSGVHPQVMKALVECNRGHAHAYGLDELCKKTEQEFKRVFGANVQPEYVFTGTAANVLGLAPMLSSFNSVICSDMAHLNMDECAAPEKFWGGKLATLPSRDGRISPEQCRELLQRMGDQHFAQPLAVSLTIPTEVGVCYTLKELEEWRRFTRDKGLMLHLDGARLSNAAVHLGVTLKQLTADLGVDAVSFGGTKNGLMGAEAVLLFTDKAKKNFKFHRKQAMQLSSKTRFLAAQFYAYLQGDLWREIATHTTGLARELAEGLAKFPEIKISFPVQSNAVFVELPTAWLKPIREKFFFYVWDPDLNMCRWMISWDWSQDLNRTLLNHVNEVKSCFPIK
jgi:threonine aldolase